MKKLLLVLFTCCNLMPAFAQNGSDWKQLKLKGKVKSLKTQETYRYKKTGVFTEWAKTYGNSYLFDKTGYTTEYQELKNGGELSYKMQYTYKPKEKKTEVSFFDKEMKPTTKKLYLYNDKGQKIENINYEKDGQQGYRYTYEYDEKGNNTTMITYKPDGKLYSKYTYTYDSKGNKTSYLLETTGYANSSNKFVYDDKNNNIEETWHNGESEVNFRFVRNYDDKGNMIKEVKYKGVNTVPHDTVTWKYEYDKTGNWTKKTEYTSDGTDFHIWDRVIIYY